MQHRTVVSDRYFGKWYFLTDISETFPETSVKNYRSMLHEILKEHKSHLHNSRSLKSCNSL